MTRRYTAEAAYRPVAAIVRAVHGASRAASRAEESAGTDIEARAWGRGFAIGWASAATLVDITAAEYGAALLDPDRAEPM